MNDDTYYKKYIKYKYKYCSEKNKQNGGNVNNLQTNNNVEFLNDEYTCYHLEKLEIDNYENALKEIVKDDKYEQCKMSLESKLPAKYNCTTVTPSDVNNKILCMKVDNSLVEKFKKINMTNGTNNVGNSCYVNSILHVLLNTKSFAFYLLNNYNILKKIIKIKNIENGIFDILIDIFYNKYNNNNSSVGEKIKELMILIFGNQDQQDASEFLSEILQAIDTFFKMNDFFKENETKLDINIFSVEMHGYNYYDMDYEKSKTTQEHINKKNEIRISKESKNEVVTITKDNENELLYYSVHKDKNTFYSKVNVSPYRNYLNNNLGSGTGNENIGNFLKKFTNGFREDQKIDEPIIIGGGPLIIYDNTELICFHRIEKFNIISYPDVLILSMGRFDPNYDKATKKLIVKKNIEKLNVNKNINNDFEFGNKIYNIYGFVVHHGSGIQGGHYVCYVKNTIDEKWYHYNDSMMEQVDLKTVNNSVEDAAFIFMKKKP